jgi:hypothetical protein
VPTALRAQTATPPSQSAPPSAGKLEDDPAFKKLSPEEQAWVRDMTDRLHKAIAAKDTAAIDQIQKEIAQHNAKNGVPAGCVATAPKKPSFLDRLKQYAQRTVIAQAGKADAKIAQKSGGNVDAGAQDATATAISQANQPKPCPAGTAPKQ